MAGFDIDRVRCALPGRRIDYFETLPSTQRVAVQLAEAGAPSGTTVVAGEQTAGIGRHGHSWHSEPESGLYLSLILYPPVEPSTRPVLTLALGLAVSQAISRVAGIECDLRWPNDIMIGGRKTAGILVQLAGQAAVSGIGINVNHQRFPHEIADTATSMRLASGQTFDRAGLLITLLESADMFAQTLHRRGKDAILDAFTRASTYARGKRVLVDMGERSIEGITAGLDSFGFLRVLKPDGKIETVLAGGVRPA